MVNSGNIKNIIFDFGGVILNIDFNRSIGMFRLLGLNYFENMYSNTIQSDLFVRLEKGLISPSDFRQELQDTTGIYMTSEEIDEAWNALLLDLPSYRIKMLDKVRNNYRTFLLSNTNTIHYEVYFEQFKKEYGYRSFDELFRKAYFSFEMGMKKPDNEIFEAVIKDQNLNPEETLFIDDSIANIEAASSMGFITHYLDHSKAEDMCWLFDSEGRLRFYDSY
jgi:glucose-1-phosphatase